MAGKCGTRKGTTGPIRLATMLADKKLKPMAKR